MISLTALVLTRNEEANIERTLRAIQWIDNVLILDSFSSDRTLEIARKTRPNVESAQGESDTHATQWNFGLGQVQTEWVFTIDADYQISPELAVEIQSLDPRPDIVGYQ